MQLKLLVFDPKIAGISGDMILGALVDLGADSRLLCELAGIIENKLNHVKEASVNIEKVKRCGISCTRVDFKLKEKIDSEVSRPSKLKNNMLKVCGEIGLSSHVQAKALEIIDLLIEAESRIHGSTNVHFHELASADTIFDVVGSLALLSELGFISNNSKICSLPIATGIGDIETKHGLLSAPAPATLEIIRIKSIPFKVKKVFFELATPTGVAILASIADEFALSLPLMRIDGIGYGAGGRDLNELPNILRIFSGEAIEADVFGKVEIISILETNIDNVTGEQIGYLIGRLMNSGALDVQVIPSIGKKNRPFYIVKVLSKIEDRDRLLEVLMSETGSLGVRVIEVPRIVAERRIFKVEVEVMGKKFSVRVKRAWLLSGKVISVRPEYEDLRRIAAELNLPLRVVEQIVMEKLKSHKV